MVRTVDKVAGCDQCPMQRLFPKNTFVEPFKGTNRRLIVAEAPGADEQIQGTPLVGGAGRIAASLYSKAGVDFKACSKLNVINCRPPNNYFPDSPEARSYCTKEEGTRAIQHCIREHVKPFIEALKPERVDLLGDKATRYIGKLDGGITRWRGSIIEIDTDQL